MIRAVLRNQKEDAVLLEAEIRDGTATYTDEQVNIVKIADTGMLARFLEKKELADFICVDITPTQGIAQAEVLRKHYPKAAIALIADTEMSPVTYMTPYIMSAALLLKPLTKEPVHQMVTQIFEHFIVKEEAEDVFIVETRDEKYRIPYTEILYFESRAKKIYACTENSEYGFYDTMDHLKENLSDSFVRCHRSYIVNRSYIKKVKLSQNCIVLKEGINLPLSRSYKGALKEKYGQ